MRIDPENALAHNNLGFALLQAGREDAALKHLERAVALDPDLVFARKNLGFALLGTGRLDDAATHYAAAIERAPNDVVAHSSLSRIRLMQGRNPEALALLRKVVELDGRDLHALEVLAWQRATNPDAAARDGKRAVALAERALVLKGGRTASLLDVLAAAQAEAGEFEAARKTATEALSLANGKAALAAGIRKRLALYEAGKPYRSAPPKRPVR